jgi:hypothetical protein
VTDTQYEIGLLYESRTDGLLSVNSFEQWNNTQNRYGKACPND